MFQIIGAMADFERSLIQERVRAGWRNARAKGRELGRPRVAVDSQETACPHDLRHSWGAIHRETGTGKGSAQ